MRFLYATLAYVVAAAILFGDPMKPMGFALFWSGRLGASYWPSIALACVAISALVFVAPLRDFVAPALRTAVFVTLAVTLPTVTVGLYADFLRHRAVLAFGADAVEEQGFFASLRNAPADFQFFLHTAALKNCRPYAWSYRTMAFYALVPNVAVNVLPQDWIARCGITRDDGRR